MRGSDENDNGINQSYPKIDFSNFENLAEICKTRSRDYWRNIDQVNNHLIDALKAHFD